VSESSEDRTWYLAQIKPNGAGLAERNLLRQGFGVFSPKIARTCRRRDRFLEELRPLFPGYLFVSGCSRVARWHAIGSTLGVQKLVAFGKAGPSKISPDLIALLKRRCGTDGIVQEAPLKEGDTVRIISGPFAEFVASIESIPSGRRIWILLDIMGRARRMPMAPADVELQALAS
jgi:transcriptional antiterminator RfaH